MRNVILYIACSVDGYLADPDGGVDWLGGQDDGQAGDCGYEELMAQVDTIVMGYRTYRQIVTQLSPDAWPYPGKRTYVFTHREERSDNREIQFVQGDIVGFVEEQKRRSGKSIWICGGAQVIRQLLDGDAIDRIDLTIVPVLLGDGIRLFPPGKVRQALRLVKTGCENGMITATYVRRSTL